MTEKKLTWRTYTIKKTLLTTRQVEIIDWKEFSKAVLDENLEAFVVHVSSLRSKISIHPAKEAQLALLLTEEVTMPTEYLDFANVFSENSANVFWKRTGANEYAIKLEKGKQPPYTPIYCLEPFEFETLKIYIKINLVNGFIQTSKSPASAPILFVYKSDGSFPLCINYRKLNNLTIKNRDPLLLIGKSLNCIGRAKQFTQLNLTSAYHQIRIKEGDK